MTKMAINGLGRIGRATLKIVIDTPGLDLVAANDIGAADSIAYLLKIRPVPVGALADIVVLAARAATVGEVNRVFTDEAEGERYRGALGK